MSASRMHSAFVPFVLLALVRGGSAPLSAAPSVRAPQEETGVAEHRRTTHVVGMELDTVFVPPMNVLTVGATADGWVVLSPSLAAPIGEGGRAASGPMGGFHAQEGQELFTPEEVFRWIPDAARVVRAAGRGEEASSALLGPPGSRTLHLRTGDVREDGTRVVLAAVEECENFLGASSLLPEPLLTALARAAAVARSVRDGTAGTTRPEPPSERPVYASHAVSCPADPELSNAPPRHPDAAPEGTPVLVQFVVDVLGRVEMDSFEVLGDVSAELREAVRTTAVGWTFQPAFRRGYPVRSLVHHEVRVRPLLDGGHLGDPEGPLLARVCHDRLDKAVTVTGLAAPSLEPYASNLYESAAWRFGSRLQEASGDSARAIVALYRDGREATGRYEPGRPPIDRFWSVMRRWARDVTLPPQADSLFIDVRFLPGCPDDALVLPGGAGAWPAPGGMVRIVWATPPPTDPTRPGAEPNLHPDHYPADSLLAWSDRFAAVLEGRWPGLEDPSAHGVGWPTATATVLRFDPEDGSLSRRVCGRLLSSEGTAYGLDFLVRIRAAARAALAAPDDAAAPGAGVSPEVAEARDVSCPALPLQPFRLPAVDPAARGSTEVLLRLVVTAAGRVDPGRIDLAPSLEPELADAVRRGVAAWRFLPARIGPHHVAQALHATLVVGGPSHPWEARGSEPDAPTPELLRCVPHGPRGTSLQLDGGDSTGLPFLEHLAATADVRDEPTAGTVRVPPADGGRPTALIEIRRPPPPEAGPARAWITDAVAAAHPAEPPGAGPGDTLLIRMVPGCPTVGRVWR